MFIPRYFKPSQGITVSSHDRATTFGGRKRKIKYRQHGQVSDETVKAVVDQLEERQPRDDPT